MQKTFVVQRNRATGAMRISCDELPNPVYGNTIDEIQANLKTAIEARGWIVGPFIVEYADGVFNIRQQ